MVCCVGGALGTGTGSGSVLVVYVALYDFKKKLEKVQGRGTLWFHVKSDNTDKPLKSEKKNHAKEDWRLTSSLRRNEVQSRRRTHVLDLLRTMKKRERERDAGCIISSQN